MFRIQRRPRRGLHQRFAGTCACRIADVESDCLGVRDHAGSRNRHLGLQAVHDFIDVLDDALSPGLCQAIIQRFEASPHVRIGEVGSGVDKSMKDSRDLTISRYPEWKDVEKQFNNAMMRALIRYLRRYPQVLIASLAVSTRDPESGAMRRLRAEDFPGLDDEQLAVFARDAFRPGEINVQGYRADQGGYPYWHCETYPRDPDCTSLHRVLLWTIYLNDGFEAGETEFLFQQRLVQPKTGALLIAPAGFTHTHRGNRPRGRDKYIATSWILFKRAEQLFPGP